MASFFVLSIASSMVDLISPTSESPLTLSA
jgi:hypothetical protein